MMVCAVWSLRYTPDSTHTHTHTVMSQCGWRADSLIGEECGVLCVCGRFSTAARHTFTLFPALGSSSVSPPSLYPNGPGYRGLRALIHTLSFCLHLSFPFLSLSLFPFLRFFSSFLYYLSFSSSCLMQSSSSGPEPGFSLGLVRSSVGL